MSEDVTDQVEFGWNDDEFLPITRCICGKQYKLWELSLSIYKHITKTMPCCGAKLYFSLSTKVHKVTDEPQ